jgi:hypothetical protein
MKSNTQVRITDSAALAAIGLGVVGIYAIGCSKQAAPPQETPKAAITATPAPVVGGGQFSPNVGQTLPNRVYWGVAHVHTTFSFDAGMFGTTLTPDDLFRVATGGEVVMDNGVRFKQDRPLDWVAITDHAEYMGISDQLRTGDPALLAIPQGKRWYEMSRAGVQEAARAGIEAVVSMQSGKPVFDASKLTAAAWAHAIEAAEKW